MTLVRAGTFGNLAADWISGYSAANKPAGLENGEITPALGSVDMFHGQEEATLTVQVCLSVVYNNLHPWLFLYLFQFPHLFHSVNWHLQNNIIRNMYT